MIKVLNFSYFEDFYFFKLRVFSNIIKGVKRNLKGIKHLHTHKYKVNPVNSNPCYRKWAGVARHLSYSGDILYDSKPWGSCHLVYWDFCPKISNSVSLICCDFHGPVSNDLKNGQITWHLANVASSFLLDISFLTWFMPQTYLPSPSLSNSYREPHSYLSTDVRV